MIIFMYSIMSSVYVCFEGNIVRELKKTWGAYHRNSALWGHQNTPAWTPLCNMCSTCGHLACVCVRVCVWEYVCVGHLCVCSAVSYNAGCRVVWFGTFFPTNTSLSTFWPSLFMFMHMEMNDEVYLLYLCLCWKCMHVYLWIWIYVQAIFIVILLLCFCFCLFYFLLCKTQ